MEFLRGDLASVLLTLLGACILYYVLKWLFVIVVRDDEYVLLKRYGKFRRVLEPGLSWKLPIVEGRAGSLSRRVQQATLRVGATTQDNVAITLVVVIRYCIAEDPGKIYRVYHGLLNPTGHAESVAQNSIGSQVGAMDFDAVGPAAASIASQLREALIGGSGANGYVLESVAVTKVETDSTIRAANTRTQAARCEKDTQAALAAAETVRRDAIVVSVGAMFKRFIDAGMSEAAASHAILATLGLETAQIAAEGGNNTVVVPGAPAIGLPSPPAALR